MLEVKDFRELGFTLGHPFVWPRVDLAPSAIAEIKATYFKGLGGIVVPHPIKWSEEKVILGNRPLSASLDRGLDPRLFNLYREVKLHRYPNLEGITVRVKNEILEEIGHQVEQGKEGYLLGLPVPAPGGGWEWNSLGLVYDWPSDKGRVIITTPVEIRGCDWGFSREKGPYCIPKGKVTKWVGLALIGAGAPMGWPTPRIYNERPTANKKLFLEFLSWVKQRMEEKGLEEITIVERVKSALFEESELIEVAFYITTRGIEIETRKVGWC